MKKQLIKSETNLVEYFLKEVGTDWCVEPIEKAFGIEFAYNSGAFPSEGTPSIEDDGTVNENIWEAREKNQLPKKYPVVICWRYLDAGHSEFRFEYVYLSDFE